MHDARTIWCVSTGLHAAFVFLSGWSWLMGQKHVQKQLCVFQPWKLKCTWRSKRSTIMKKKKYLTNSWAIDGRNRFQSAEERTNMYKGKLNTWIFPKYSQEKQSWTKTMLADATTRPADKPLADLTAEVLGEANEAAMTPRWDVVGGCVDGEEISCHFVNAASCPLIWSEVEKHVNARTVAVTEEDKLNCPTS